MCVGGHGKRAGGRHVRLASAYRSVVLGSHCEWLWSDGAAWRMGLDPLQCPSRPRTSTVRWGWCRRPPVAALLGCFAVRSHFERLRRDREPWLMVSCPTCVIGPSVHSRMTSSGHVCHLRFLGPVPCAGSGVGCGGGRGTLSGPLGARCIGPSRHHDARPGAPRRRQPRALGFTSPEHTPFPVPRPGAAARCAGHWQTPPPNVLPALREKRQSRNWSDNIAK